MTAEKILSDLQELLRIKEPVDLLSVYQGVPVAYKAKLLRVNPDNLLIGFKQQYEAVCLLVEKKTTLLSEALAGPVTASIQVVDLPEGTAVLGQLRYAVGKIGDRMVLRVMPATPIEVEIEVGGQRLSGMLADMSMSGLGVRFSPAEKVAALRPHAVVQLTVPLPTATLRLMGTVNYIKTEGAMHRMGVTLAQVAQAQVIFQYIHHRRDEILRELQALYQEKNRPPA